jgi:hypothetical protein
MKGQRKIWVIREPLLGNGASTVLSRLKEEVAELQGGGRMDISFPKIISARNDDEPELGGSKKEGP